MRLANILVIDDQPDTVPLAPSATLAAFKILSPEQLDPTSLNDIQLVLVDLKMGNWTGHDVPFAATPRDGLAVIGNIAAYLRERESSNPSAPPVALALLSGALESDLARAGTPTQEHLLARVYGLEWIFSKEYSGIPSLTERVSSLGCAVSELPASWPDDIDRAMSELQRLLRLHDDSPARDLCWREVLRSQPPLHELARPTDGVAILRWLLHRVLPYPTFLWNTLQLATRFRVRHQWLKQQLDAGPLRRKLSVAAYSGILQNFSGPRWWGAAIDGIIWDELAENAGSITATHEWLGRVAGSVPERVAELTELPVVSLDDKLMMEDEPRPMDRCVRLLLDDWPAHAEPPWTTVEVALRRPNIAARVIEEDRDRLLERGVTPTP